MGKRRAVSLRVYLFGPMRAFDGDSPIQLPPRSKLPSLWAYLLVNRERATPRTLLASTFWPDRPEAEARLNLRRHLHRLQQVLPAAPPKVPWVVANSSSVQWNPSADAWIDLAEFECLSADPARLAEAVELYRGDLLEGIYDDWMLADRERLRDLCFLNLHGVVERLERDGAFQSAIVHAQRLLRLDPLREETYRTLMRLHARSGDRAGVVRLFNACRAVLERELRVAPSEETQKAYHEYVAEHSPEPAQLASAPTTGGPRSNLPALLTSFVGRDRERSEVGALLGQFRLVTLTGIGGVGKTRLALAAAEQALPSFPDGAWWVDLAPLVDPGLIGQAVASAVGLREQSTRPISEALGETLRTKRTLLILDNCEHLVEACADLVDRLLREAPNTSVLTTSTEPLGVSGERVFPVPPLEVPDPSSAGEPGAGLELVPSVSLFVERAVAALPTFRLSPANRTAVARLCRALDGIPLALELAAARLKLMSVEQLVEGLDDRFRLLAGGNRNGLPRHRTLQAVLDWSHALLTESERALLRRLSLFVGGFTLESAEAVCAGEPLRREKVLELLSELVDKSLVTVSRPDPSQVRYGLLETVGHYARAKLIEFGRGGRMAPAVHRVRPRPGRAGWPTTPARPRSGPVVPDRRPGVRQPAQLDEPRRWGRPAGHAGGHGWTIMALLVDPRPGGRRPTVAGDAAASGDLPGAPAARVGPARRRTADAAPGRLRPGPTGPGRQPAGLPGNPGSGGRGRQPVEPGGRGRLPARLSKGRRALEPGPAGLRRPGRSLGRGPSAEQPGRPGGVPRRLRRCGRASAAERRGIPRPALLPRRVDQPDQPGSGRLPSGPS